MAQVGKASSPHRRRREAGKDAGGLGTMHGQASANDGNAVGGPRALLCLDPM